MFRFRSLHIAVLLALVFALHGPRAANCDDSALDCLDARVMTEIQKILKKKKYYNGPVDGRYSKKLRVALDDLRDDNGIGRLLDAGAIKVLWGLDMDYGAASSEERPKFLKAIGLDGSQAPSQVAANCNDRDLKCLDSKVMMEVQKILKRNRHYNGPIDGKYSKKVRAALDDLIDSRGGVLDADTVKVLWGLDMNYGTETRPPRSA